MKVADITRAMARFLFFDLLEIFRQTLAAIVLAPLILVLLALGIAMVIGDWLLETDRLPTHDEYYDRGLP